MMQWLRWAGLVTLAGWLGCVSTTAEAGDAVVELKIGSETVDVVRNGRPWMTFHFGKQWAKPFFSPVRAADGTILTRPIRADEREHPHHKGIWIAVDEVNGIKFWAERGRIENQSVKAVKPRGNPARLEVVNHWLGSDGKPLLVETTAVDFHADGLTVWRIQLAAASSPVTFEDTKEGLFAFRMADWMREREGGHVVNSDGLKGAAACWGKPAKWVDYVGEKDGTLYGVALFDHPDNFRPSRYHVRDYGLFAISPFGQHAYTRGKEPAQPVTLEPNQKLLLRYGLYVHLGDTEQADVAGAYKRFVEAARR